MLNWAVINGAPVIAVLAGLWLPHVWLPFVAILLIPILVIYGNYMSQTQALSCALSRRYTEWALGISALIMLVINLSDTHFGHKLFGLSPNSGIIPYVPAAIIYPALTAFTFLQWLQIGKTEYCRACSSHAQSSVESTLITGIYHTQIRYLIILSLTLLCIESAVILVYFFTFYINVNYNASDTFFFFIFPTVLYFLSAIYVYLRFSSLRFGIATMGFKHSEDIRRQIRYLVIKGEKMLLAENHTSLPGVTFWDTPIIYDLSDKETASENSIKEIFTDLTSIENFSLRQLYFRFDHDTVRETIVCAVFLPDDADVSTLDGEWLNTYAIDKLYNSGALTKSMNSDVRRIFIITMAWKTYTLDGKRLYPIKNYRPTFHIGDFKNWDVDYNDLRWVEVYKINEDRLFWRLRKFWRTYVSGVSGKWQ